MSESKTVCCPDCLEPEGIVPLARPDDTMGDAWVCTMCGYEWPMHPKAGVN